MSEDMMQRLANMLHENNAALLAHMDERLESVEARMERLETRMDDRMEQLETRMEERVELEGERTRNEIKAYIENTVIRRIDALFDGYVSVRERQDAMQKEMDDMHQRLEKLELVVKSIAL